MNFQIFIYNSDGSLADPGILANIIGKGSDTSYMNGSGTYYFTINTAEPYVITVEQKN